MTETKTQQKNLPFVLFLIKGGYYAVASENVREIIVLPQARGIPESPPEVRGVINLRNKVVKLIDLRIKLGFPSLRMELEALSKSLEEREEDHRRWLAELEACVRERRAFKLARDPHKCKFGLWYDEFSAKDRLLGMILPSMDAPHKAIHATANEVLRCAERGDANGALELISSRRNHELEALIKLFKESRRVLAEGHREVAVVLSRGNDWLAFSADRVEAAEHIPQDRIAPLPAAIAGLSQGLRCWVAQRAKTDQTILILDEEHLFDSGILTQGRSGSAALGRAGSTAGRETCRHIETSGILPDTRV